MPKYIWKNANEIPSFSYKCGYCGESVAPDNGWVAHPATGGQPIGFIYICHYCTKPTFRDASNNQHPGVTFGEQVDGIEDKTLVSLYDEARNAMSVNSYTLVVLSCRKLLMHIAVSKGADTGKSFVYYVEYLSDNHYIPPGAEDWVDHIREKGNEANHEINIMDEDDAELLLSFIEMLLKVIYEFPTKIEKYIPKEDGDTT